MATANTNGSTAQEFDRLIADFRQHVQQLMAEKQQLVEERDELRRQVEALKAKAAGYLPILREWSHMTFPPEEAERIMRQNQWVDFKAIQEVLRQVQGA